MAVAHTTALTLLGKYISFKAGGFYHQGVVESVFYHLNGKHELCINFDDFYFLSDVEDVSILGDIILTA